MEDGQTMTPWLDKGVNCKKSGTLVEPAWVDRIKPSNSIDKFRCVEQKGIPEEPLQDLQDNMSSQETGSDKSSQDDAQEEEVEERKTPIGLDKEKLYKDILYEVVHVAGCREGVSEQEQLQYIQDAFRTDKDTHTRLLDEARSRTPPTFTLNVEVFEAKNLTPSDVNGLSDPFCILYLASDTSKHFKTSVKEQTLNPVWEEQFSIPVANPNGDHLCLEVRDFDPEETVIDKFTKITVVNGGQGFVKLFEETLNVINGNQEHEHIGYAEVNLQKIPVTGQTTWIFLKMDNSSKYNGEIKVKMVYSTEKNAQASAKLHQDLLWVFAMHEIESLKAGEEWTGQLSDAADSILKQHALQNRIAEKDLALAQWVSYSIINTTFSVSSAALSSVLQKLLKHILNGLLTEDEICSFWNASRDVLPSCFKTIKTLWKNAVEDPSTGTHLKNTISILATLNSIQLGLPQGLDIFSSAGVDCLIRSSTPTIHSYVEYVIITGALDWFNHLCEEIHVEASSEKARLKQNSQIIRQIHKHLKSSVDFHEHLFFRSLKISYTKTVFTTLEFKIKSITEPLVQEIFSKIEPLSNKEQTEPACKETPTLDMALDIGGSLFELYKEVQCLAMLGTTVCPTQFDNLSISKYHTWFFWVATHWFDIVNNDIIQHVVRAVALDRLEPICALVKHSSSAVDTVELYYRKIKVFWHELSWPQVDESFVFLIKILNDVGKFSELYADNIVTKIHKISKPQNESQKEFRVTKEWCLAVNNIDYLKRYIEPFVKQLGVEDILNKIAESIGHSEAEECKNTLDLVLKSITKALNDKLSDVLDTIVQKQTDIKDQLHIAKLFFKGVTLNSEHLMILTAQVLLMESILVKSQKTFDNLIEYLDENLTELHSELSSEHFNAVLTKTFLNLVGFIDEAIKMALKNRRHPTFFAYLHTILKSLNVFFWRGEDFQDSNNLLSKINEGLTVLGTSTADLITQVNDSRLRDQKDMHDKPLGKLTVKLRFVQDTLHIDVLNARNLVPMDSNGFSDPYVTIKFLPAEKFEKLERPKTKVIHEELFPIFDETFTIPLTREQRWLEDGMLIFMVKDQDFHGVYSQFMGEAYVPFKDIPDTTEPVDQTHLVLSVPSEASLSSDVMLALSQRVDDKLAREFVKRQKAKSKHGSVPT